MTDGADKGGGGADDKRKAAASKEKAKFNEDFGAQVADCIEHCGKDDKLIQPASGKSAYLLLPVFGHIAIHLIEANNLPKTYDSLPKIRERVERWEPVDGTDKFYRTCLLRTYDALADRGAVSGAPLDDLMFTQIPDSLK